MKDGNDSFETPTVFRDEEQLLAHVNEIDLLVIASPNYMHTPQLLRWGKHNITILVEKPVAISNEQVSNLKAAKLTANIWVAMEYRFIPAINKLLQLLPEVGPIKKVTIRENRYPFLSKIEEWNKDVNKSGDTLVEKCCHFFDLFRLITSQEMDSCVSKIHRGLLWDHYGYQDQDDEDVVPIIDSAYVLLDFVHTKGVDASMMTLTSTDSVKAVEQQQQSPPKRRAVQQSTIGCLELCMFAEGSRHQEEIIVTGMKGRVEAYLPENKVFLYQRPTGLWTDKSKPPPPESYTEEIFDCTDLRQVYDFADDLPEMHSGYHYCSTAIEWKYLIDVINDTRNGKLFTPKVTLDDGIKAVEMGIASMVNISNGNKVAPVQAHHHRAADTVNHVHDVKAVFVNNGTDTTSSDDSRASLEFFE